MPVNGKPVRELLLLFLLLLVQQSYAQRITRQYNNVSFSAALKDLNARQHKYTINFVYDELEDFRVTKSIRNQSVPDAIMQLIGFYPIRMTQVEDNIMVECTQKTTLRYKGRIIDESGNAAEYANITLLSPIDSTIVRIPLYGIRRLFAAALVSAVPVDGGSACGGSGCSGVDVPENG